MPRLLLLTLACWLTLMAVSGAIRAIAYTQPMPDVLGKYQFAFCGDRLCFRGMKPGFTAWKAAQGAPGYQRNENDPYRLYFPLATGDRAVLSVSVDMSKVDAIELQIFEGEQRPALGAVLATFGPRCGVVTSDGKFQSADYVALMYPFFDFASTGLDLNTPINDVYGMGSNQCDKAMDPGTSFAYTPWLGMRSIKSYKL